MNHETNKLMGNPPEEELTNKEKKKVVYEDPRQGETVHYPKGETPKAEPTMEELEKAAEVIADEVLGKEPPSTQTHQFQHSPSEKPLAKAERELEESARGESPPINDQQEPIEGRQSLPTGAPLPVVEQLAHTQVAYQGLLEDFEKVSKQFAEAKEEVKNCTRVNFGVRDILEVPEGESVLLVATALKQELTELKEVPGDAIQVASLQGQVSDLQDNILTLHEAVRLKAGEVTRLEEAVRLKQQVIDKLENRVTDLQMASQEVPTQELPADLKSLLKQVADLQEANRILKRKLQGTV